MKTYLMLAAAAVAISGCSALGGGQTFNGDALMKILTDPACAHDDEFSFVTGAAGIPASLTGKAARHCPMPTPAPAASAATPGK